MAETLLANIKITAIDQFSRITKKLRDSFKEISKAREKAAKTFALAGQMNQAAAAVGSFARVARGAVAAPIAEWIEFEQAMANVKAVTKDLKDGDFPALMKKAREMGSSTRFSAKEAAEGLRFFAVAGFTADEQMAAIKPTLQLATAGMTDLGRTADIVSDLMGGFGLGKSVEATKDTVDVLAATFTNSNTTLDSLFETMKLVGPGATKLGVSFREVAAMTGLLGSAGIKGSLAGTQLKQMFAKMVSPTKKAREALKEFGISFVKDGELRDRTKVLGEFLEKTKDIGRATRAAALGDIFGVRAKTAVDLLLDAMSGNQLPDFLKTLNEAPGTVGRIEKIVDDTAGGAIRALKSAVSDLGIQFGMTFKDDLKAGIKFVAEMVRGIAGWLKDHPTLTKIIFASALAVAFFLTALQVALIVIATMIAAGGLLILVGGFKGLAAILFGPVIAAIAAVKAAFIATLMPSIVAATTGLGTFATAMWAAVVPSLIAAAPIAAVGLAITAVALAVNELVKAWDQLDLGEGLQGIAEVFGEEGVSGVVKGFLDPSALVSSVKSILGVSADVLEKGLLSSGIAGGILGAQGAVAGAAGRTGETIVSGAVGGAEGLASVGSMLRTIAVGPSAESSSAGGLDPTLAARPQVGLAKAGSTGVSKVAGDIRILIESADANVRIASIQTEGDLDLSVDAGPAT